MLYRDGTSWFASDRSSRKVNAQLVLERLEDRTALSATPTLDLSTAGALGQINGGIFQQAAPQPAGSGVIDAFVRVQAHGSQQAVEQGVNTDARPLQFDENSSPTFTRSLHLSEVPTVDIGGIVYREFVLDINQKSSSPLLSLDQLRFYVGATGNLTGYDPTTNQLGGLKPVYDLNGSGAGNWILLNAKLNPGIGKGNMIAYIPDSDFQGQGQGADPFVYLYSEFGVNQSCNGGFEQWAPASAMVNSGVGAINGSVCNTGNGGSPLANVQVFIDANGNGVLDQNEVYTFTDANGNFSFSNLETGMGQFSTYNVMVIPPPGFLPTATQTVSLQQADQIVTLDFCLTPTPPPTPSPATTPPAPWQA
jgi:hypothetical protein